MKYKINKDITSRDIEDETIILNCETGCYYSLNSTGSRLWTLISKKKSFDKDRIIKEMLTLFNVKEERIKKDINGLIQDMLDEKILVTC